jgi:hypothetical protein
LLSGKKGASTPPVNLLYLIKRTVFKNLPRSIFENFVVSVLVASANDLDPEKRIQHLKVKNQF